MTVRRFRKKPVEIRAVEWTGDNLDEVAELIGGDPTGEDSDRFVFTSDDRPPAIFVRTAQGQTVGARPGEWIVPEAQPGRAYPIDPTVFAATYDEITEEDPPTQT